MNTKFDVIVVGARCAGSPTAMLLARLGHRVLLVDRAELPSDTISTHLIHPPGIAALSRWGLLGRLVDSGCPPISAYSFDFGPFTLHGSPGATAAGINLAYGPRRTVLDTILLEGALAAGVEVWDGYAVDDVLVEDDVVVGVRGRSTRAGSAPVEVRAALVVGADGRHSTVASAVGAESYREVPARAVSYYAYWSDLPVSGFDVHFRPGRVVAGMPTHGGLNCLVVAAPRADMEAFRGDLEGNYRAALDTVPEYADRIDSASRESRFVGMAVPNFYRSPFGSGWALVGDAGHDQDPCTAQGITCAFHDAERLASAWHSVRTGAVDHQSAMAGYQQSRDEATLPMYELTCQLAAIAPPSAEQAQLFGAMAGNQAAMDSFVSMIAGTMPVPEFFSEEHVGKVMAGAR